MICIIGGSGFIGSRLCRRLLTSGRDFSILDKEESVQFRDFFAKGDVRSVDDLRRTIPEKSVIINLAAEHRDDVRPKSLYDEVNVDGAKNICQVAREKQVKRIVFTSSVAIYGFAAPDTDELGDVGYFNDYGRTKWLAEQVFRQWQEEDPEERSLTIVRPTVVFGEQNRGNVYNLLRQIASGKFLMIGSGENRKSMAYVENIAAFIEHLLDFGRGVHVYNYIDKPDLDMNTLVMLVREKLGAGSRPMIRLPYIAGLLAGYVSDVVARTTGKSLPISSIRVRKFCATTQFATSAYKTEFVPPVSLALGIERTVQHEFLEHHKNEKVFYTE